MNQTQWLQALVAYGSEDDQRVASAQLRWLDLTLERDRDTIRHDLQTAQQRDHYAGPGSTALLSLSRAILGRVAAHKQKGLVYPKLHPDFQARIRAGQKPVEILRGLTRAEAHEAMALGYSFAEPFLIEERIRPVAYTGENPHEYGVGRHGYFVTLRPVAVLRWLEACLRDPQRRAALFKEDERHGMPASHLTEIAEADLPRGPKTSLREALENSRARMAAEFRERRFEFPSADPSYRRTGLLPAWYLPTNEVRILLTAEELDAEGREMRHCVGSYAYSVQNGITFIVSVKAGGMRSTAEVTPNLTVKQHRGKSNVSPGPACEAALREAMKWWRWMKDQDQEIAVPQSKGK